MSALFLFPVTDVAAYGIYWSKFWFMKIYATMILLFFVCRSLVILLYNCNWNYKESLDCDLSSGVLLLSVGQIFKESKRKKNTDLIEMDGEFYILPFLHV